jgi:hypothetical protein
VIVLINADTTTDHLLEAMDKLIIGAGFIGQGILKRHHMSRIAA